nr:MAG TPA: hypothetical protein [Caudoviricetes sp.]
MPLFLDRNPAMNRNSPLEGKCDAFTSSGY